MSHSKPQNLAFQKGSLDTGISSQWSSTYLLKHIFICFFYGKTKNKTCIGGLPNVTIAPQDQGESIAVSELFVNLLHCSRLANKENQGNSTVHPENSAANGKAFLKNVTGGKLHCA